MTQENESKEVDELAELLFRMEYPQDTLLAVEARKLLYFQYKRQANEIIEAGYRKSPSAAPINGGYFGTHCHICHEAVGICKCRKEDAGLVALDEKEVAEWMMGYTGDMAKAIRMANNFCAKFGKDNSGMDLETLRFQIHKRIRDNVNSPAEAAIAIRSLFDYLNSISQQPPKERKVSLERKDICTCTRKYMKCNYHDVKLTEID